MFGGAIGNLTVACFAAGTPLVVDFEGNSRSIEDIEVGDDVLARSEFDAAGPLELKRVEEKFVRVAPVMELVVRGQVITTTAEHPFYVAGEERFVPAGELTLEDSLVESQGRPIAIDAIRVTDRLVTVYNLRVADFHTYFVGGKLWQFDAWVHNAATHYALGSKGLNSVVDAVATEITNAATSAEVMLKAGKTGGTRWGHIYQRYAGTGHWIEKLAYGNAIQQIADQSLMSNEFTSALIKNNKLLLNQGSKLGVKGKILLRPDYQLDIGSGQWAILDISTSTQQAAGKISSKYAHSNATYLIDISY